MLYGADIFLGPALRNTSVKNKKGSRAMINKLATIQRKVAIMIVGRMRTSPTDALDVHANLLPFQLTVDKVRFKVAIRLATLLNTHPLHNPVKQAAQRFVKRHHTPLHKMMYNFKIKPNLMEKIKAVRQGPKCELNLAIRIAGDKEQAKKEDEEDGARIKVYTDGSGCEGQIRAAVILYCDRLAKSRRRMRLGSN